jgi:hypothetical protein
MQPVSRRQREYLQERMERWSSGEAVEKRLKELDEILQELDKYRAVDLEGQAELESAMDY